MRMMRFFLMLMLSMASMVYATEESASVRTGVAVSAERAAKSFVEGLIAKDSAVGWASSPPLLPKTDPLIILADVPLVKWWAKNAHPTVLTGCTFRKDTRRHSISQ